MTDHRAEPAVRVREAWFSYNGAAVLKGVNLDIHEGEFCALMGPNGGGKTTLVKLMLGLLTPERGTVRLFGGDPRQTARWAGYVPQQVPADNRFPVTVEEVVLMGRLKGLWGRRRYDAEDRRAAEEALGRMEIRHLRNRRMGELSGGQRQRTVIARALASNPRALFLDEPAASVDTKGQGELYEILRELNREKTIVMVSHELVALSRYVKSVACVNRDVHYHGAPEMTRQMMDMAYECPVELFAHGVPHRVVLPHEDSSDD